MAAIKAGTITCRGTNVSSTAGRWSVDSFLPAASSSVVGRKPASLRASVRTPRSQQDSIQSDTASAKAACAPSLESPWEYTSSDGQWATHTLSFRETRASRLTVKPTDSTTPQSIRTSSLREEHSVGAVQVRRWLSDRNQHRAPILRQLAKYYTSGMSDRGHRSERHLRAAKYLRWARGSDARDPAVALWKRRYALRALGLAGQVSAHDEYEPALRDAWAEAAFASQEHRREVRREELQARLQTSSPARLVAILYDLNEPLERRDLASELLGLLAPHGVGPQLVAALAEGRISWMRWIDIAQLNEHQSVKPLLQLLRTTSDETLQLAAIQALWLGRQDRRIRPTLIYVSQAPRYSENIRSLATEVLSAAGPAKAVIRTLGERLFDDSVDIRYSALCAIGTLGVAGQLSNELRQKLNDPARLDDERAVSKKAAELLLY